MRNLFEDQKAKWLKFHKDNPHVYVLFKRFAFEAMEAGHQKLSAWLITNRIRWETTIVTRSEDPFKVSNNHIAYYARLFMSEDPVVRGGFFRLRPMRGEDFEATKRACGMA